jgi:UrcA family protein
MRRIVEQCGALPGSDDGVVEGGMPMKTLILAAIALAVAGTAAAEPASVTTSIPVSLRGLDPGNPGDTKVVLARLDRAALSACGASTFSLPDVKFGTRRSACYGDAMSTAVGALHEPALSAAFAAHHQVTLASS